MSEGYVNHEIIDENDPPLIYGDITCKIYDNNGEFKEDIDIVGWWNTTESFNGICYIRYYFSYTSEHVGLNSTHRLFFKDLKNTVGWMDYDQVKDEYYGGPSTGVYLGVIGSSDVGYGFSDLFKIEKGDDDYSVSIRVEGDYSYADMVSSGVGSIDISDIGNYTRSSRDNSIAGELTTIIIRGNHG